MNLFRSKVILSSVVLLLCLWSLWISRKSTSFGSKVGPLRPTSRSHHSPLQSPVKSFDPIFALDTNSQLLITNSFDGLVDWSPANGFAPSLASVWHQIPGKNLVVFELRRGVFFSDGSPLSALDVVRHFNRLLKTPGYFRDHYKLISTVKEEGQYKVIFKLRERAVRLLPLLSGVAARIVKVDSRGTVIGAGPYVPVRLDQRRYLLDRNPLYWKDQSGPPRIEFEVQSEASAIAGARAGRFDDLVVFSPAAHEIDIPGGEWVWKQTWATWAIGFDQRVAPFNRYEVRRAIIERLQSKDWISRFYPDQREAYGLIPLGMPGALESRDLSVKRRHLKRPDFGGAKIYIPDVLENRSRLANWVEASVSGLRVMAVPFDWMMANYAKGKMGGFLVSINAEYPDPGFLIRSLHSSSDSNFLGIRNPVLDRLIVSALNEEDPEKRAKRFRDVNQFLRNEAVSVNLMHVRQPVWIRNCVKGLVLSPVSEGYHSYREVKNECID